MAASAETIARWQPQALGAVAGFLRSLSKLVAASSADVADSITSVPATQFAGIARTHAEDSGHRASECIGRVSNGLLRLADACERAATHLQPQIAAIREALAKQQDPFDFGDQAVVEAVDVETKAQRARDCDSEYAQIIAGIVDTASSSHSVDGEAAGATNTAGSHGHQMLHFPIDDLSDRDNQTFNHPDLLREALLLERGRNHSTIAFGDISTAKTVITFVPGTGSSASDISGQLPRIDALISATDRQTEEVAVVLHSYDAPDNLLEAASPHHHEQAIHHLQTVQADVVAQSAPGAEHVVAGYSYGATVTAQATSGAGLYADRVLLIASPGAGPNLPSAQDMRLLQRDGQPRAAVENTQRIAVATSPNDLIRAAADAGIHGRDTNGDDFGATVLDLDRPWWEDLDYAATVVLPFDVMDLAKPHTEHYFNDDIFQRKTQEWLGKPILGQSR